MQLVSHFNSCKGRILLPKDLEFGNLGFSFFVNGRKENAALLIGNIFGDKMFLERLDPMDVQTFLLETVTRACYYLQTKPPMNVGTHIDKC